LLEVGFWSLYLSSRLKSHFGYPPGIVERIGQGHQTSLYCAQQHRDALNTFVALIVLIRRAIRPLCLDRLGSNPLEHAFGSARMPCRDGNTMKKLTKAFTSGILTHSANSCLELATIARHRVSLSIDCPPCSRIERSIFSWSAKDITASLLVQTGIHLNLLCLGLTPTRQNEKEAWKELCCNPESLVQPSALTGASSANLVCVTRRSTLWSDRILMGVINSPRASHLMSAHSTMGRPLGTEFEEVETELASIFGRRLTVRKLELRVNVDALRLHHSLPNGKTRTWLLEWLHVNWVESKPVLLGKLLGH
jgi:hypothetical protein